MRKIFFLFVLFTSFGLSLIFFRPSNSISNSSFIKNKEEEEKYLKKKEQTAIERNEYFFMLLRDPGTNSIPENIREKEIAFASTLPKSEERLAKGLNAHEFNWKEAGPFDVGGRTRALVVDISNNNTIIAGGVSGGIWKSTDKGVTWSFKSSKSSILSVTSIAQDTRPGFQNIWYAVGGELDGNSAMARGGNAFFYGGGFYRSTDNGESWSLVKYNNSLYNPNGTSFNSIFSVSSKVLVSPTTGSVFVASNSSAIFKSTDGGSTWIYPPALGKLNDHYYVDIIVNKNGVLVASLSQKGWSGTGQTSVPGIYKSVDDGVYWQSITPSEFPTEYYRTVMAFGTSNPNVVYTLTNTGNKIGSTKKDDVRLFKINISTGTANELTVNLPDFSPSSRSYIDTQVNYNMAIAVHPNDENIVFIAGTSLFRSLDGFATKPTNQKINWIGGYNPTTFYYPQLHPDIHTIVFDQESTPGIWVGHDGGISYAQDATVTNYDTYFPWYDRDNLYNVTQYYTMAISPTSGDTRIFGGTQDNGTPLFRWNGTNATSSRDATSSDGSYAYIGSQTLNGKIYSYGSTQNGVVIRFGTDSNGDIDRTDWSVITPSGAAGKKFINPYTVDPDNENYMYYIAGNILWRNSSLSSIPEHNQDSTSQGWSSINLQIPAGYSFSTIAVSRTPASILYLAASSS
ncbi:MAG: sialidase family protein, partial [Bacteroidota bacterium]